MTGVRSVGMTDVAVSYFVRGVWLGSPSWAPRVLSNVWLPRAGMFDILETQRMVDGGRGKNPLIREGSPGYTKGGRLGIAARPQSHRPPQV